MMSSELGCWDEMGANDDDDDDDEIVNRKNE